MERMTYIFWQNINSMHQSAFLKALAMHHDVTLITMMKGTGREDMGWIEPELPRVNLLHIREIDWRSLIRANSGPNVFHVFAGLHAFRPVHRAMKYAMQFDCRIGVYAEPLVMKGIAGVIKQIRGYWDALTLANRLDFVLCIGKECRRQYISWGFPEQKLHDWAYVTELPDSQIVHNVNHRPFRIIFPASCSPRKGADILLEAAVSLPEEVSFELICYALPAHAVNAFERRMISIIGDHKHIRLLPFVENEKVKMAIGQADLLVLPSRFDGWGAVVNEALSTGTPVLVSDHCGSAILIEENAWLGVVFGPPEVSSLREAMLGIIREGAPSLERREKIRTWASSHISGHALAVYFMDIVTVAAAGNLEHTQAPWKLPISPISSSVS